MRAARRQHAEVKADALHAVLRTRGLRQPRTHPGPGYAAVVVGQVDVITALNASSLSCRRWWPTMSPNVSSGMARRAPTGRRDQLGRWGCRSALPPDQAVGPSVHVPAGSARIGEHRIAGTWWSAASCHSWGTAPSGVEAEVPNSRRGWLDAIWRPLTLQNGVNSHSKFPLD